MLGTATTATPPGQSRRDISRIIWQGSHTCSITSKAASLKTSLRERVRRAETVVDYLISKRVDPDQIKAQGYGESKPIAYNTNLDGTDNVRGRARNRRTEFKIIGEIYGRLRYFIPNRFSGITPN